MTTQNAKRKTQTCLSKHSVPYSIFTYLLLATCYLLLVTPSSILAQTRVRSDNYEIQLPGFNSGAGLPKSDEYWMKTTIGQTAAGEFSSAGFRVKAGFEYIHSIIPFTFSISDTRIDFGSLSPNTPVTETSTLTVSAGGAGGYTVFAQENHPLRDFDGTSEIPDTLCDSGICSELAAGLWTQNSTHGFGFNIWGDDIPDDFITSSHFRQFANAAATIPEPPAAIMSRDEVTYDHPNNTWPWKSEAVVTFKVNVGQAQPAGKFQNVITFTAVPGY